MMQSQLCEKKKELLQAQLEGDVNKINRGGSKKSNKTSKGARPLASTPKEQIPSTSCGILTNPTCNWTGSNRSLKT